MNKSPEKLPEDEKKTIELQCVSANTNCATCVQNKRMYDGITGIEMKLSNWQNRLSHNGNSRTEVKDGSFGFTVVGASPVSECNINEATVNEMLADLKSLKSECFSEHSSIQNRECHMETDTMALVSVEMEKQLKPLRNEIQQLQVKVAELIPSNVNKSPIFKSETENLFGLPDGDNLTVMVESFGDQMGQCLKQLSELDSQNKRIINLMDSNKDRYKEMSNGGFFQKIGKRLGQYSKGNSDKPPCLRNLNFNCYLNSLLQALASCDKFVYRIKRTNTKLNGKDDIYSHLSMFNNLLQYIHSGGVKSYDISKEEIFNQWNKSGPQDSFELLSYTLSLVFSDVRRFCESTNLIQDQNDWLKIKLPMRISVAYHTFCCNQNSPSSPLQVDYALHLPFPPEKYETTFVLQDLIDRYFEPDRIEEFKCENKACDGKHAFKTTTLIPPLPSTLCLHLQRARQYGKRTRKVENKVTFDSQLIIRAKYFVAPGEMPFKYNCSEFKSIDLNNFETIVVPDTRSASELDEVFNLKAVIVHQGSNTGHYLTYRQFHHRWFYTSDTDVYEVDEFDVLKSNPTILFYEKTKEA